MHFITYIMKNQVLFSVFRNSFSGFGSSFPPERFSGNFFGRSRKKVLTKPDLACIINAVVSDRNAVNPCAAMAQAVERILGKDEVTSSILVSSSKKSHTNVWDFYFFTIHFSLFTIHYQLFTAKALGPARIKGFFCVPADPYCHRAPLFAYAEP